MQSDNQCANKAALEPPFILCFYIWIMKHGKLYRKCYFNGYFCIPCAHL